MQDFNNLATSKKIEDKLKAAQDTECPAEALDKIVMDGAVPWGTELGNTLANAIASNPNCPPEHLSTIYETPTDDGQRLLVLQNPNCPKDIIDANDIHKMNEWGCELCRADSDNCSRVINETSGAFEAIPLPPEHHLMYLGSHIDRCKSCNAHWLSQFWEVDTPERYMEEWGEVHRTYVGLSDLAVETIREALSTRRSLPHDTFRKDRWWDECRLPTRKNIVPDTEIISPKWKFKTAGEVSTSPVVSGGVVFFRQ